MHHSIDRYADALVRDVRGDVQNVRELPVQQRSADVDASPSESEPEEQGGHRAWMIDIAAVSAEEVNPDISRMQPAEGGVRILIEAPDVQLACGDIIELPLRMRAPDQYRDPGVWQYADWLREQGIAVRATTRAHAVNAVGHTSPGITCRLRQWQQGATASILHASRAPLSALLPPWLRLRRDEAGVLAAMLAGDRSLLDTSDRLVFERTGTFHLVVVAGMHIGILAGVLLWLMERLRVPRVAASLLTGTLVSAYALFTGFGQPVQRALWMTLLYLLARSIQRRGSNLNSLGFAVMGMLWLKPSSLFDASFQMTALAVIAISGIALPLSEHTFRPLARGLRRIELLRLDQHMHPRLAEWRVSVRLIAESISRAHQDRIAKTLSTCIRVCLVALEFVLISVVSELLMSLPMMIYFHRLTPAALPANLLAVPLITPLVLCAVAMLVAALVHPSAGALLAVPAVVLLRFMQHGLKTLASSSLSNVRTPAADNWQVTLAVLFYFFALWLVRYDRKRFAVAASSLVVGATAVLLIPPHLKVVPNTLEVSAIDVGQGDSLLVVSPDGKTMLVDAGGPTGREGALIDSRSVRYDVGEEVVAPYLWDRRIRRLDVLALTHAHSDHIGGMLAVLRNFRPRELWISAIPNSSPLAALLIEAKALNIPVRTLHAGDRMQLGAVALTTLAPRSLASTPSPQNNDSMVLRLQWQNASALLEGDAEAESESQMLGDTRSLSPVTLLKVAHHGSRTSSSQPFVEAVHPTIALISDGRNNTFGHPRMEVIDRLAATGAQVFRTDMHGAVTVHLFGDGHTQVSSWNVR